MAMKDWKPKKNIYGKAWSNQAYMQRKGEYRNYVEVFYTKKKNNHGKFVGVIYQHPDSTMDREEFDTQEEAKEFIKKYMRSH